jgi:hypothetical protein
MTNQIKNFLLSSSSNQELFIFAKDGIVINKGYWKGCYLNKIYEGDYYYIREWLERILEAEEINYKTKTTVQDIIKNIKMK